MAAGKWWLRTAVTATLLAMPPCAVIAQTLPTSEASIVSPEQLAFQIQSDLKAKLTSPRSTQADKEEAAKRLLARRADSVTNFLLDTLKANGPAAHDQRVAVAKAIADNLAPDPQFIPPLEGMLGPDRPSTEAAAAALVRYSDNIPVQQRLLDFARDAKQPAASREAAARAMGNVTLLKQPIARSLVDLAADNNEPPAVRNAAMDALGDSTGFSYGHDATRWRQWFAAAPQNDTAWTADISARHEVHEQQLAREKDAYAKGLERIISGQYQSLLPNLKQEQGALILSLLNDADPHVRSLGIKYCTEAFGRGRFIPAAANDRIQDLLGDSNVDVRLAAAQAVQELNLVKALDSILAQLTNEPNADVRDAMVGALGRINDLRAVPTLQQHLTDPSIRVATTAAYSLQNLASRLREKDQQQADRLAEDLWKAQNGRNNRDRETATFRAACIDAIGKLQDPKLDEPLLRLGEQIQEPNEIRAAAFRALASPRNRRASIRIARDVQNEPLANKEVRIAQINALAGSGKFEEVANFLNDLNQPNEPDAQVRAAAWDAFKALLPTATDMPTLTDWSQRLRSDPARRLVVLDALTQKLKQANSMNDWASQEQNRGEVLMELGRYDQAAAAFLGAMDFWNKSGPQTPALPGLAKQTIQALLKTRDFNRACTFAADQLKNIPYLNPFIGPEIRDYADHLIADGKNTRDPVKATGLLNDAVKLIDLAKAIDPPLEKPVLADLDQLKADADRAIKALPATRP